MKNIKRFFRVLKYTGTLKMFTSFIILYCISSMVLWLVEPDIKTVGDGFWYCYVACTTIGFGDYAAATHIGRLVTILASINCIVVTAMIPGVIVSYYMDYVKYKEQETFSLIYEKLEQLPELSQNELVALSKQIKEIDKK